MKSFLFRVCAKIGRFFWSWGFLKFVLWTVTIIILFYVEEDWRGARMWAATKAEWEAKGESFDYANLIPPPVPDDQNLAMIPLFKLEPDPENKGELSPVALHRALRAGLPGNNVFIPHSTNWLPDQLPDMEKIREVVATDYAEAFKAAPPSNDSLAQFDALFPFVSDLRTAAASRPYCRFPRDYPPQLPYDFLRLVTPQLPIARILNLHAILALDAHKSDVALADLKTCFKLISGLRQEPFLVSGLVAIGMQAISFSAIYDGLALHSWNDAQLAELENEFSKTDFLSDYQHVMRGELMGIIIPSFENLKTNRSRLKEVQITDKAKLKDYDYFPDFWPDGWLDQNESQLATSILIGVQNVDAKSHRVFPTQTDDIENQARHFADRIDSYAPWNIFFTISNRVLRSSTPRFAQAQVWIDEARIACALERYRLAHGVYPESLDALVPAYAAELPHDIINGEPYHYRLRPDGTFLLYSVGWNQKDDGGKVVYEKESPMHVDYKQGDWVWPTPQVNAKAK